MVAETSVPVAVQGLSLGSAITGAGVWTGVLTLFGIILRSRVPMRKLVIGAEENLRGDLLQRLQVVEAEATTTRQRLEEKLDQQRTVYEEKLEQQRAAYEAKIEKKDAEHAAELSQMRHRMNNIDHCLDMLLALIEANPDRAQQAATMVREMRLSKEQVEAAEKGAIHAARIAAATPQLPPA